MILTGIFVCQPVSSCYGPHITATVLATQININENVTITGKICLEVDDETNLTVRETFAKPDYSWIDQFVQVDNETGEFTLTQKLDMAGYLNIF